VLLWNTAHEPLIVPHARMQDQHLPPAPAYYGPIFPRCYFSKCMIQCTLNVSVSQEYHVFLFYKQKRHNIPISLIDLALKLKMKYFANIFTLKLRGTSSQFLTLSWWFTFTLQTCGKKKKPDSTIWCLHENGLQRLHYVPVHSMDTDFQQNVIIPLITYAYCHGCSI
jgi:hypothetical protein